MAANPRIILLDHRFLNLARDQQHALRELYKHDRRRGWGIADARYYVNAVVDHVADHQLHATPIR